MITAITENGAPVLIDNAETGRVYFCPVCRQPLDQKRGDIRIHHFAHKRTRGAAESAPCTDTWHYDMTEWHIEWQKRFPLACIEKVLTREKRKHIADVAINSLVIEFQHSPISIEDFRERNRFYTGCGYSVIWVFDVRDEVLEDKINYVDNNEFHWTSVKRLFRSMDLKKENVTVYFQFSDGEGDYCLERVTGGYHGFSVFYTDTRNALTVDEFVAKAKEANSSLISRKRPASDVNPVSVKGGKTVFELWRPEYKLIVVKNLLNGKEMLILGDHGEIPRQNNRPNGNIMGKYTARQPDGSYSYSDPYVVWDAEKPIWALKTLKRRRESELTEIQDIDGCSTLVTLLVREPDASVFFCEYNKKAYILDFIGRRSEMRFNAYEFDAETGEISSAHQNPEVQRMKDKKVWVSLNRRNA